MGGAVTLPDTTKISLEIFQSICGDEFHEEIFDLYKDRNGFLNKSKLLELIQFKENVNRSEEVFHFFVKHEMVLLAPELKELMNSLGFTLLETEFLDPDGTKTMTLPEFIQLINNKIRNLDENLYNAFCKFDVDRNGFISKQEFKEAMNIISGSEALTDVQIQAMAETADQNQDGQINLEEFKQHIHPKITNKLKRMKTENFESYRLVDADHNGKVTVTELEELLRQISNGILTEGEMQKLLTSVEVSAEGSIVIDEFNEKVFPKIASRIKRIDAAVLTAFRMFDIDKNGFISPTEFRKVIVRILRGELSNEDIDKMIEDADMDHDGMININEFKRKIFPLVEAKMKKIDEAICESFRLFDLDKSGLITPSELFEVLKDLTGGQVDDEDINQIVQAIDLDGDGNIHMYEFRNNYYQNKVRLF